MGLKSGDNPRVFVGPETLDCGCSCQRDVSGYLVWTRCPLHAHAGQLLEALGAVVFAASVNEAEADEMGWTAVEVSRHAIEMARAAIAKAEE